MKEQASIFSLKPVSPVELFVNENFLDKLQNTEFKRTTVKFLKEFMEFKENTMK